MLRNALTATVVALAMLPATASSQHSAPLPCKAQIVPADLCDAVAGQILETDPSRRTHYTFQTKIYAASCVDESADSAEVIQQRIQVFWLVAEPTLTCSQLNFSVKDGHILKLAVERNSRDFINDVVRKWKLSLNHVDRSDGRTVLDYIAAELAQARSTNPDLVPILQRYFDLFRSRGAKYASEL